MMNFMNILLIVFASFTNTTSQYLVGNQRDEHNCVLDGGYQWCESTQSCVRSWETYCSSLNLEPGHIVVDPLPPVSVEVVSVGVAKFCPDSTNQMCRRMCEQPVCPTEQCAMRTGNCCEYTCTPSTTTIQSTIECFAPCPPPMPCPEPAYFQSDSCKIHLYADTCGCQTRCPSFDCRNSDCNTDSDCMDTQFCRPLYRQGDPPPVGGRRLQTNECIDKLGINGTCGGYTVPEFQTRCLDSLDCVNTMGPMIADAPGQCRERCHPGENRDDYGNCIVTEQVSIPSNCATWFDGCNTCQVVNGKPKICTLMYCFREIKPYCMNFNIVTDSIQSGEVCYRFCEDNSQAPVNRKNDCPRNTICKSVFNEYATSMIAYDSCDSRAWTCVTVSH